MGCGGSKDTEEGTRSAEIDKFLEEEKVKFNNEVKLLLLGSGESGKSTVAKQMKIIYLNGFTEEELLSFKPSVYSDLVLCMRSILKAANDFGYEINSVDAAEVLERPEYNIIHDALSEELVDAIKTLWKEKGIKKAYERRDEYQLYDCAEYLLENIDRISTPNYVPTSDDVIVVRVKTTGISEIEFVANDVKFKLVDVGGQRNERRKWMHCFEDVTAVIFVVALSEYNLTLYEDGSTNRMDESLKLFKEMCNNQWFSKTSMIVFLNKRDLFEEKLSKYPLSDTYPEYKGGDDFDKAVEFITNKFESQNTNPNKTIYFHITCATDTKSVEAVFKATKDVILKSIVNNDPAV